MFGGFLAKRPVFFLVWHFGKQKHIFENAFKTIVRDSGKKTAQKKSEINLLN